jgi:hypothetical protein
MDAEYLLEKRKEIIVYNRKQNKLFDEVWGKVKKRIKDKKDKNEVDAIKYRLEDFLFNNIYYKPKDINKFIDFLIYKEILLENEEEL